jgi:ATP-dependent protease ClpP protease subunit
MSFKVEHEYDGIQTQPPTFVYPSMLQGQVSKSSQWEPVVISLTEEIDSDVATFVSEELKKAENTNQPFVPFYIDSPGGSVYGLMSIITAMQNCKIPIYTFTSGLAASCAACIFCLGKRRFMTKHARLLIHDVSLNFSGENSLTSSNIKAESNEMHRINKIILQTMAENIGHPPKYFIDIIKTRRNNDIYVDAKQALQWKMATDIGFPVVKVNHSVTMNLEFKSDSSVTTTLDQKSPVLVKDEETEDDSDDDTDVDVSQEKVDDGNKDDDIDKVDDVEKDTVKPKQKRARNQPSRQSVTKKQKKVKSKRVRTD